MPVASPDVDAYIAALPEDRRGPMTDLRETIRAAAPDADEVITYGMPGFRSAGTFLVSYDAFKAHYSLFPASDAIVEALGDEVRPHVQGRGTLRFRASEPLPLDLIRRIVEIRVRETAEAAVARANAKAKATAKAKAPATTKATATSTSNPTPARKPASRG